VIVSFSLRQIERQSGDRGIARKKPSNNLTLVFGNQTLSSGNQNFLGWLPVGSLRKKLISVTGELKCYYM